MAAYTRKQYSGAARNTTTTTLLTNVGTTVDITATTGWPSIAGIPFYVVISPSSIYEEKCLATISGSTLTLDRAKDDTTASEHPIGSVIYPVFTANDADEANEIVSKLTTTGDLLTTDGTNLLRLGVGEDGYFLKASSSASAGIEWASIPTINSLDDVGDVSISDVEDGDFLVYNNSASAWINETIHFITVSDTEPTDEVKEGDLWYNSSELELYTYYSNNWIQVTLTPEFPKVEELDNVYINTANAGDVLAFDGLDWYNDTVSNLFGSHIISLSGDVSGSVVFDGSASVNIPTTIQIDSITLGTDTHGDYVSSLVAGTGVILTNNSGESATPTIAIGQAVGTSSSVQFASVTAPLTGNASTATALETARTISLTGDLSGSVSFNGTSDVSISATVEPNSIALGTDTVGVYVADLIAGTGVTINNGSSESASPTISIGQDVATSACVTFAEIDTTSDTTVGGVLTANSLLNAAQQLRVGSVEDYDAYLSMNNGAFNIVSGSAAGVNIQTGGSGWLTMYSGGRLTTGNTPEVRFPGATLVEASNAAVSASTVTASVFTGDLTGNADTATALETARTIGLSGDVSGSASFDGTASINIFTTVNTASVAINELYGVSITNPEEFQTLEYDGTNWVNSYAPVVTYVRNAEATTLTTGTVVYLFGGNGDHATVKRADNSSETTSSKTVGVVGAPIEASENGPVITRGYVDGINLSAYNTGDALWLGTNGQFNTTKAVAPQHLVFVGVVVRATNNGIMYVATQNGYEINELHDVKTNGKANKDVLMWNSASAVWTNEPINLGTDTVGDYVQSLVAGTGVTLVNNSGESSTPTISIGQDVSNSSSVTFAQAVIQGNLSVQGTITRVNETNLDIVDSFIYLNATSASVNPDFGIAANYNDGSYKHAGVFRDSSDGKFKFFDSYTPEPENPINVSHASYSAAPVVAKTFESTVNTGTAPLIISSTTEVANLRSATASELHTPRIISLGGDVSGSVSFSGSSDVTITSAIAFQSIVNDDIANGAIGLEKLVTGEETQILVASGSGNPTYRTLSGDATIDKNGILTISENAVELGTNTTGNYVNDITAGTGVTVTHTPGEGSSPTIAIGQNVSTSSSVQFAEVTAPLVGNASTATTLQTARAISLGGDLSGSVSFNGSTDVTLTATISANSVALGTDTTGNYMSGVSAGTGVSISHTPGEGSTATISTTGVQTLGAKAGNYTLAAGDAAETIIIMDSSSANDLTVPSASAVSFTTGTSITVVQRGIGKTRILAGSGVTLLATPGLFLRARYSSCTIVKTENANEWFVIGDLAAS